jgi:hypothetical protein
LQRLKRVRPQSKVLILSMHTDPALIMQALESGAHGYLLKDTTATELEHALEALRNNERYLSPAIAHTVINQALTRNQKQQPEIADSHNLTARQLEILRLIVRGKSTREIANGLGLERQDGRDPSLTDHEAPADLRRGRPGAVRRARADHQPGRLTNPAPLNNGECSGKCTRNAAGRAENRMLSPSSGSPSRLMQSPSATLISTHGKRVRTNMLSIPKPSLSSVFQRAHQLPVVPAGY